MSQRSCLFTTLFLEGYDPVGSHYVDRVNRYLDYYMSIKEELGFEKIILLDNRSTNGMVAQLEISGLPVEIIQSKYPLYKLGDTEHDYPYVWRGLYKAVELLQQYDKVFRIDSDSYILSKRLANYLRDDAEGFETMHLHLHGLIPADEISVLTREALPRLKEFCREPWSTHHGKFFEHTIPITRMCKEFHGERYGLHVPPIQQTDKMDWYGAASVNTKLEFRR